MSYSLFLYILAFVAFIVPPVLLAGLVTHSTGAAAGLHPSAGFLVFLVLAAIFLLIWSGMAYLAAKSWYAFRHPQSH